MLGSTESEVNLGYRILCLKRKRKKKKVFWEKKNSDLVTEGEKGSKSQRSEGTSAPSIFWT